MNALSSSEIPPLKYYLLSDMTSPVSHAIKKCVLPARRCIFGRADPKETTAWLKNLAENMRQLDELRWGFSFVNDCPTQNESSSYMYEVHDAASLPAFYRPAVLRGCPSSHLSSPEASPHSENECSFLESEQSCDSTEHLFEVSEPLAPLPLNSRRSLTPKKKQTKITREFHPLFSQL